MTFLTRGGVKSGYGCECNQGCQNHLCGRLAGGTVADFTQYHITGRLEPASLRKGNRSNLRKQINEKLRGHREVYEKLLLLCSFMGSPVSELPPGDFNLEFPKLLKGIRQGIQGLSCPEDLQEMALCSRRRNQSIIVLFAAALQGGPL